MATLGTVQTAILLFDRFAALDAVTAHDAFSSLAGMDVTFVATRPGPWRDETGRLELTADAALREVPLPHVAVVPGGAGIESLAGDRAARGWLRAAADQGWIVTVGAGALLAVRTGLLADARVAAPDALHAELAAVGALAVRAPVAIDGRIASARDALAVPGLAGLLPHSLSTIRTTPKGIRP